MQPQNNAVVCAYFRRANNVLGDDIKSESDLKSQFLPPIYFKGRKEVVTKQSSSMGGLWASSSQSYIETNCLPLEISEMKKDDVIVICGRAEASKFILDGGRLWRVQSFECHIEKLRVSSYNEELNERMAPKRIAIT